jgi:hypothetical protein
LSPQKGDGIVVVRGQKEDDEMIDEVVELPTDGCREVPAELPDPPGPGPEMELTDIRY